MILGLGSDLVDIRRIEKTLERFGERFTERCFTDIERTKSDRRAQRAERHPQVPALARGTLETGPALLRDDH